MPHSLADALLAAVPHLPTDLRDAAAALWQPELLERLADRLTAMRRDGVVDRPPPPFAEETTPPLGPLFEPWRPLLDELAMTPACHAALAYRLEATGVDGLLVLLGMRRTPGSRTGPAAIPPTTPDLLRAAEVPFRDGEELTAAGRAWTKHVPRSGDGYWGVIRGAAADYNRAALGLVRRILKEATWWNVHEHFQLGSVFEARVPTGHGARWQMAGPTFVGFLEMFQPGGIEARERKELGR